MTNSIHFATEVFDYDDEPNYLARGKYLSITVSHTPGADGWDELEERLDGLTVSITEATELELSLVFNTSLFEETEKNRLGRLLKDKLGNVTALKIWGFMNGKVHASLIQKEYFPNVVELDIRAENYGNDIFLAIGSFRDLKKLSIEWPKHHINFFYQEAIDNLGSSLARMEVLREVAIGGTFWTPSPPEDPGISVDPIVVALRAKATLVSVKVHINGVGANGVTTFSISEDQQKTLRIGCDINNIARWMTLPRRRYQAHRHQKWVNAVESAQQKPGLDDFEQFHFFFSQLPADIIETIPQRCANPEESPSIQYILGNCKDPKEINNNRGTLILGILVMASSIAVGHYFGQQ